MSSDRKEYAKLYREKNKEKINARHREYNKSETRQEYLKKYRENNKEKQKEYEEHRKLSAPERYLIRDRERRVLNNKPLLIFEFCQAPPCENKINHKVIDQKYCSKKCCKKAFNDKRRGKTNAN